MTRFRISAFWVAALIVAAANKSISIDAQTTTANSPAPAIAVSLTLQKDKVSLGQSPYAFLTIKNLTTEQITIVDPFVYVEGPKGKLFLRPQAQVITKGPRPRMPRLRTVVYVPQTIPPEETITLKYQLAWLFDFHDPGQYTIYMDVIDPSTRKSLRTNSLTIPGQCECSSWLFVGHFKNAAKTALVITGVTIRPLQGFG
jgi:hypothetical protein